MNKRLAILTQPLGHNYGGLIQNYALQTVLKRQGLTVETISREFPTSNSLKRILVQLKNETFNRLKGCHRKIFSESEKAVVYRETIRFIREHISVSEKVYSTDDIKRYFEKNHFDYVVVGSDQTWRPRYSPNIYNYYLDFLQGDKDIKKLAYASSFGTDEWEYNEHTTEKCRELAKEFDAISVREDSGVNLCDNYLGVESTWVLDPTLLLLKEDYEQLFQHVEVKQEGLFNYVLDRDTMKQGFILSVAKDLGLSTFNNQPKRYSSDSGKFSKIEDYIYPSIETWLKSFYDASYVVTDSFHGTVFSIIFNKPFLSIVNKQRGASRFQSLLSKFGLEDRLVSSFDSIDYNLIRKNIDFDKVNDKLRLLREKSLDFLNSNIV